MRFLAVFVVIFGLSGMALAEERQIQVTGLGHVEAAPDMAVITLGAHHQAKTARAAMDQVSNATKGILARLEAQGIESRDMQTSDLSLNTVWDHSGSNSRAPKVAGFSASNRVTVRVRDLSILGKTLDAVISDGANSFNGLRFGLQNPEPVQDEARKRAVTDARRKATLYAEAAGVSLGKVMRISESAGASPAPVMMARSAMMDEGVPVASGEISTQARVSILFTLVD